MASGLKFRRLFFASSKDGGAAYAEARLASDNTCECCRLALAFAGPGRPVVVFRNIFEGGVRDHAVMTLADPATPGGFASIAFVHGYENLAAALGNAVLLVYLLTTCKPRFKAAHYAIGSAIMSIPSRVVGGFGGAIVTQIGFLNFFILGFVVSLPAMLLLFVVPLKDDAAPGRAHAAPAAH